MIRDHILLEILGTFKLQCVIEGSIIIISGIPFIKLMFQMCIILEILNNWGIRLDATSTILIKTDLFGIIFTTIDCTHE